MRCRSEAIIASYFAADAPRRSYQITQGEIEKAFDAKRKSKDIITNVREENERKEGNKKLYYQLLGDLCPEDYQMSQDWDVLGDLPPMKKLKTSKAKEDAYTPRRGASKIASGSRASEIKPGPRPMTAPASSSKVSTGPRFPKGQIQLALKSEVTQFRDQVARLTREVTDLRLLGDCAGSKIKTLTILRAHQDHALLLFIK